jgi:hypothetical protein
MSPESVSVRLAAATAHERTVWHPFSALRVFRARASGFGFLLLSLFQHSSEVEGIEIRGPHDFCDRVAAALRLLSADAPTAFDLCQRHFNLVIRSRHSGVNVTARPATVMLGQWATSVSTPYLASGLAHEANHCSLYWSYRDAKLTREVPRKVFSGEEAERQCLEYQIAVLKQLGETEEVTERLRESMKTEWWNVPWHERRW